MNRRRRPVAVRDQALSGFSQALQTLCEATHALSAALVDSIGETVDYAGVLDPYETRVAAAEWGLIIDTVKSATSLHWARTSELYFRGKRRSFAIVTLVQGYSLVLELPARRLQVSHRALGQAVRAISEEGGLEVPRFWAAVREHWTRVHVLADRHFRRPGSVLCDGRWLRVEVLGRVARDQLGAGEIGYRVRVENGAEITLVREPLNLWYVDDPLALEPDSVEAK